MTFETISIGVPDLLAKVAAWRLRSCGWYSLPCFVLSV